MYLESTSDGIEPAIERRDESMHAARVVTISQISVDPTPCENYFFVIFFHRHPAAARDVSCAAPSQFDSQSGMGSDLTSAAILTVSGFGLQRKSDIRHDADVQDKISGL